METSHIQGFNGVWDHAKAGHLLAIISYQITEDITRACKGFLGDWLKAWAGFGFGDHGLEEFLVVAAHADNAPKFQDILRQVVHQFGLSVIVADSFELTLLTPIFREGQPMGAFRRPIGIKPHITESPGEVRVSFEPPIARSEPECLQWISELQDAYAEMQGYQSFAFAGAYA